MNANIIVFLDDLGNLDVTQRSIDIGTNPNRQTINWWLFGKLTKGSFLPAIGPYLGFEWTRAPAPPLGVFENLRVLDKGKRMAIDDINNGAHINIPWPYILRILLNGEIYETVFPLLETSQNRGKNPVIINK